MQITFEQSARYFAKRLNITKGITRDKISTRCPFHGDRTESLSISVASGVWKCFAGCGEGGLIDFELKMFPGRSRDECWESIERDAGVVREKRQPRDKGTLVASYDYHDASGLLVYQKQRYEPKNFVQRAWDGRGWKYSLDGVRKVLYRLPELVTSNVCFITEGEKDCEMLRAIDFSEHAGFNKPEFRYGFTCNFDGAGRWKDEYSPYFAGKTVLVMEDNDDAGREHAQAVARSVAKFARTIKIIQFPELPNKGDVSDFLATNAVGLLLEKIKSAPKWEEAAAVSPAEKPFFERLENLREAHHEWLVPGVIHRGGKGIIVADPKAGKSMAALDLVVALASQQSWFGMPNCNRPVRSGVVSREDSAGMCKTRVQEFARGRQVPFETISEWTRYSSYDQRASFSLQDSSHLDDIIKWIKHDQLEFVVFDVLNYLHSANENDNTEMGKVMKALDRIRLEAECQVTVIHHTPAAQTGTRKRPRGAGAIDSWWDWKIALSPTPENEDVKEVQFGTKIGRAHPPITVTFDNVTAGVMQINPAIKYRRA